MQYAVGETATHDGPVVACKSGLHAVEYPLDVLSYYAPAESRYAVVRAHGAIARHDSDTKIAAASLTIEAEIGIPELVQRAIDWITARCKPEDTEHATGDWGAASSTGDWGAASSTGDLGAASSTGDWGAASSTGYRGAASAMGKHGVALAAGYEGRARAAEGSAIVLTYREPDGAIRHIRAGIAGRDGIKPDTWYVLSAEGEFYEVAT